MMNEVLSILMSTSLDYHRTPISPPTIIYHRDTYTSLLQSLTGVKDRPWLAQTKTAAAPPGASYKNIIKAEWFLCIIKKSSSIHQGSRARRRRRRRKGAGANPSYLWVRAMKIFLWAKRSPEVGFYQWYRSGEEFTPTHYMSTRFPQSCETVLRIYEYTDTKYLYLGGKKIVLGQKTCQTQLCVPSHTHTVLCLSTSHTLVLSRPHLKWTLFLLSNFCQVVFRRAGEQCRGVVM